MQPNRFVVLTGHLRDYPLPDLVGILRHQRKTGRLTIEYPKGPAFFFFNEGEVVDAQMKDLTGLQAICVARAQPDSAFNFNPLVRPSRRSIEPSLERVVSELLGCWDETPLEIVGTQVSRPIAAKEREQLPERANELLLLPPGPPQTRRRWLLYAASAAFVLLVVSTLIGVTVGVNSVLPAAEASRTTIQSNNTEQAKAIFTQPPKHSNPAQERSRVAEPVRRQANQVGVSKQNQNADSNESKSSSQPSVNESKPQEQSQGPGASSVNIVLQIENGRVLKASVAGHKPGMDSYEAMALRIAKQRRYPAKQTGQETLKIDVARPN
ncbi:MAG: hypothetical protein C5B55_08695 [Blastocatellia bacterium]|nr:MAG: hypothetical protein C5B55_08695 [Blastocatellia bacterium]